MTDIASFQFKDPLASFNEGYGLGNALQSRVGTVRAGNALAGGDYDGAAGELFRSGQLPQGQVVRATGVAQDQAQQDRALKFTVGAMTRLQDIHRSTGDVNQTLAAFDTMGPQFKQIAGETDEGLAEIRDHLARNPDATLAALGAGAAKQYQAIQGKDGGLYAFDAGSGTAKTVIEPDASPKADWKEVKNPDGSTRFINLNDPKTWGAATASQVAQAQPGAVTPDAVWASIKRQESGGEARPGEAVGPDTPYGHALGSTQMLPKTAQAMAEKLGVPFQPELLHSNTPEALAYQDRLGRAYFEEGLQKSGGDLAGAAEYYFGGPDPALHGPKTKAYAQAVLARAAGRQSAPAAAPELASAAPAGAPDMATAEAAARAMGVAWNPSMMRGDTPAAKAYQAKIATGLAGGIPGSAAQVPDWAPDPGHPGYLRNRKTGATKADPEVDYRDLPVDPNELKMVLEGRYPAPTTGRAATDPHWQALVAAAAAADPGFDAANYATRVKTRQSFLSGTQSQNVTSLNTVVGHLDALDHSIDHLNNTGDLGPLNHLNNEAAHFLARQSGTGARLKDFDAKKTAVANELTRVFRGAGGAEADIQGYLKQLDTAASPKELHATVKAMAELVASRLQSVADSYNQGMGLSKDPVEFLHPEQQRAFSRLLGESTPAPGARTEAPAAGAPDVNAALAKARAAIANGADPEKVKQRLVEHGINPADL